MLQVTPPSTTITPTPSLSSTQKQKPAPLAVKRPAPGSAPIAVTKKHPQHNPATTKATAALKAALQAHQKLMQQQSHHHHHPNINIHSIKSSTTGAIKPLNNGSLTPSATAATAPPASTISLNGTQHHVAISQQAPAAVMASRLNSLAQSRTINRKCPISSPSTPQSLSQSPPSSLAPTFSSPSLGLSAQQTQLSSKTLPKAVSAKLPVVACAAAASLPKTKYVPIRPLYRPLLPKPSPVANSASNMKNNSPITGSNSLLQCNSGSMPSPSSSSACNKPIVTLVGAASPSAGSLRAPPESAAKTAKLGLASPALKTSTLVRGVTPLAKQPPQQPKQQCKQNLPISQPATIKQNVKQPSAPLNGSVLATRVPAQAKRPIVAPSTARPSVPLSTTPRPRKQSSTPPVASSQPITNLVKNMKKPLMINEPNANKKTNSSTETTTATTKLMMTTPLMTPSPIMTPTTSSSTNSNLKQVKPKKSRKASSPPSTVTPSSTPIIPIAISPVNLVSKEKHLHPIVPATARAGGAGAAPRKRSTVGSSLANKKKTETVLASIAAKDPASLPLIVPKKPVAKPAKPALKPTLKAAPKPSLKATPKSTTKTTSKLSAKLAAKPTQPASTNSYFADLPTPPSSVSSSKSSPLASSSPSPPLSAAIHSSDLLSMAPTEDDLTFGLFTSDIFSSLSLSLDAPSQPQPQGTQEPSSSELAASTSSGTCSSLDSAALPTTLSSLTSFRLQDFNINIDDDDDDDDEEIDANVLRDVEALAQAIDLDSPISLYSPTLGDSNLVAAAAAVASAANPGTSTTSEEPSEVCSLWLQEESSACTKSTDEPLDFFMRHNSSVSSNTTCFDFSVLGAEEGNGCDVDDRSRASSVTTMVPSDDECAMQSSCTKVEGLDLDFNFDFFGLKDSSSVMSNTCAEVGSTNRSGNGFNFADSKNSTLTSTKKCSSVLDDLGLDFGSISHQVDNSLMDSTTDFVFDSLDAFF